LYSEQIALEDMAHLIPYDLPVDEAASQAGANITSSQPKQSLQPERVKSKPIVEHGGALAVAAAFMPEESAFYGLTGSPFVSPHDMFMMQGERATNI